MRYQYMIVAALLAAVLCWRVPPKCPPPCPKCPDQLIRKEFGAPGNPVIGGFKCPEKDVYAVAQLPAHQKRKNVGGRDGAGLCVFTSIEYASRWQNEPRLADFQTKMRVELGGGWPDKVDKMIAKYGKGVGYVQHTGGDLEFLRAALKSGRMPAVTYNGHDPNYGKRSIAHMVNIIYLDDQWAAITDNNFPGENQIVWMSVAAFKQRWMGNGGGWAVVLLSPPPPPVPHN